MEDDDVFAEVLRNSLLADLHDRTNRKQVLHTVNRNGSALEFLPEWQDVEEVVLKAIQSHPGAMAHAHPSLRHDLVFVLKALSLNPFIFPYIDTTLQHHPDVFQQALLGNPLVVHYMPVKVLDNPLLMALPVHQHPSLLRHVSPRIRHHSPEEWHFLQAVAGESVNLNLEQQQMLNEARYHELFNSMMH